MAKRWFGPVLSPCGCCYEPPPPPPPPPCACNNTECFAEDELNFSSVKIEIDIDDGWTSFGRRKRLNCSTNCRNVYDVVEFDREVSGFSAFNGTYDIPYYVFDDYTSAWVTADPLEIPCGVWFYPTLSASITSTVVARKYSEPSGLYEVYNDDGCASLNQTTTQTRTFYLETRSGLIWAESGVINQAMPGKREIDSYFIGSPLTSGTTLSPSILQRTIEASVFACSSYGSSAISESNDVDAQRPEQSSPFWYVPFLPDGLATANFDFQNRAVGVGWAGSYTEEPRKHTGYPWGDYPYGGPGIPVSSTQCKLDAEEYEENIYAMTTDLNGWTPISGTVACNPFFPFVSSNPFQAGPYKSDLWYFENSAWRRYYRCLINT